MKALPILKKVAVSILTALFVSFLTYGLLYISPGDPADLILSSKLGGMGLQKEVVMQYAEILGLNKGFFPMYRDWFVNMLHGDLGTSYLTGYPVIKDFVSRIGVSAQLALMSTAISLVLGVTLGILSGRRRNSFIDRFSRFYSSVSLSVPSFWLAILFLWLFALKLGWFPIADYQGIKSLILPAVVMGVSGCASLIRVTRSGILDNLSEGYVVTARARGLNDRQVFLGHILKNVMLPVVTMVTSNLISHIGGSVIIENVFSLPGVGNFLLRAIKLKDFPAILGFVFLMGMIVVVLTTIADLLYMAIDPRVRQGMYEKR
jgi:peptide/nickel transport system permease protein